IDRYPAFAAAATRASNAQGDGAPTPAPTNAPAIVYADAVSARSSVVPLTAGEPGLHSGPTRRLDELEPSAVQLAWRGIRGEDVIVGRVLRRFLVQTQRVQPFHERLRVRLPQPDVVQPLVRMPVQAAAVLRLEQLQIRRSLDRPRDPQVE